MGRRIVLGLEPSDYSKKIVDLAIDEAKAFDTTLIGVAAVDVPGIIKAEGAGPAGAIHYGEKAVQHHIDHAQDQLAELLGDFEQRCKAAGVPYEIEQHSGSPDEVLARVALSADLLVIGARTFYHFESQPDSGDTLKQILRRNVCPVFVVPMDFAFPIKHVLLPYDASPDSSRAMRFFSYVWVGDRSKVPVTLLHVSDDYDQARKILKRPQQFLEAKGYTVKVEVDAGDPKKKIPEAADKIEGTLVVLGAYGHGSIAEVLFGSTTSKLIADQKHPLFISA